jgi:hypothetical protein
MVNTQPIEKAEPTPSSPWRSMEWSKPQLGKTVLFFYRGRVVAGVIVHGPTGQEHMLRFEDLTDVLHNRPGQVDIVERADLTHWRDLPQEKP